MNVSPDSISRTDFMVCPLCEAGELRVPRMAPPSCRACGVRVSRAESYTLRQIAALPVAIGAHACDCGHPEMRLLPNGIYRCPACDTEVLPHKVSE